MCIRDRSAAPQKGEALSPVFHISTNPVYRAILWVCTEFSTVSTWFSTFPQWKDVENLCKMWRKPAAAGFFAVRSKLFHTLFIFWEHAIIVTKDKEEAFPMKETTQPPKDPKMCIRDRHKAA